MKATVLINNEEHEVDFTHFRGDFLSHIEQPIPGTNRVVRVSVYQDIIRVGSDVYDILRKEVVNGSSRSEKFVYNGQEFDNYANVLQHIFDEVNASGSGAD